MYRILVVDDEGLELQSLNYLIEQNFVNICQLCSARNGRDAIELADSFAPDIAIMDIQMPGISGISAMREIRKGHPELVFIVLTAYDSFEYARESIELGVFKYLTKPLKKQELLQSIEDAIGQINLKRRYRQDNLALQEKLETAIPMLEYGLIYGILLQKNNEATVRQYKNLLGLRQEWGYFMVFQIMSLRSAEEPQNTKNQYERLCSVLRSRLHAVCSPNMGDQVACVIFCDEIPRGSEQKNRRAILERVRTLQSSLQRTMSIETRAGIGSVVPVKSLVKSYEQALRALSQSSGVLCHFDDLPAAPVWEKSYPAELEYQIYGQMERGDAKALVSAGTLFDWMTQQQGAQPTDVKLKVLEIVMRSEYIAFQNGSKNYHFVERHGYLEQINGVERLHDLRSWYLERLRQALESVSDAREEKSTSNVALAEQFILQHYHQELSLKRVAEEVHISPYYFSRIFKEETGLTFMEYLTSVRMNEAKRRLKETHESVKEISASIGYSDPNYFSRAFKKNTGCTPREYREGMEQEGEE